MKKFTITSAVGALLLFLSALTLMSALGMDYLSPDLVRGGAVGLRDYQLMAVVLAVGLFIGGVLLIKGR